MDKVVILARVSTDKQEYRRQVNELKSFCQKMDWEIIGTFTNKISGAESLENRKELIEMIELLRLPEALSETMVRPKEEKRPEYWLTTASYGINVQWLTRSRTSYGW